MSQQKATSILFDRDYPADAWELLRTQFTETRITKMEQTARERTLALRLIVQDIYQPHNISACLRSADAFGVQLVDVVNGVNGARVRKNFKPSTVTKGGHKWLSLRRYNSVAACAERVKEQGYVLAAGYPDHDATPLSEVPLDRPIALVFGNEHAGVSDEWKPHLDYKFTIPMVGMVESLNISVSCAISLFTLRQRMFESDSSRLVTQGEVDQILNAWAYDGVSEAEAQLDYYRGK